jgi:SAM-dependent methyltransferase
MLAEIATQTGYDEIADVYDTLFCDAASLQENVDVFVRIGDVTGKSVLDVGCGTGLFLDYATPLAYVGIDPSRGMLRRFRERHPEYAENVEQATVMSYAGDKVGAHFDLVAALFGVGSYLTEEELRLLPLLGERVFAMFYRPGYVPETYRRTGVFVTNRFSDPLAVFERAEAWGNFLVVDTR